MCNMTEIVFHNAITQISELAFVSVVTCTSVELPERLVHLRGQAFYECTALQGARNRDSTKCSVY